MNFGALPPTVPNLSSFDVGDEINVLVGVDANSGKRQQIQPSDFAGTTLAVDFSNGIQNHYAAGAYDISSSLPEVSIIEAVPTFVAVSAIG